MALFSSMHATSDFVDCAAGGGESDDSDDGGAGMLVQQGSQPDICSAAKDVFYNIGMDSDSD